MTFHEIFNEVKEILSKATTEDLDSDFALQCNVKGEGEGTFYIAYKDGRLQVEPFDYKDNDASLTASDENFIKLLTGKLNGTTAVLTGKLKIDGSIEAAKMLQKLKAKAVD